MSFMEDPHPWRVEDGEIVDATGAYVGPSAAVAELERLREQRAAVLREIERGGGRVTIEVATVRHLLGEDS